MSLIQALPDGTELVSDFKIEHLLGAGGFGITYLAREIALDRKVAVKEYFPNDFAARRRRVGAVPRSEDCAPDYQWGLERFIEEAQTLAKFDHPNIVRVYRYFRANNTGYMVLHFEEGQSLKSWLQSLGRAPRQAELDRMIAPMLDALAVVHAADFLHRDIAPDNIIIRNDGSPVLIDFGAARGDIAQHSRTVSALVKPGYSPYEQYGEIGRQQGPWTDIYALSATLYHAITGKRPPDAPSRVVKDELAPSRDAALSAYRPSFLKAIDRGLRIDIEKRPQTIAAWRAALLAPDEQRGWFGSRRADSTVVADDDPDDAIAATRLLTAPARDAGTAGQVPPPPDVPDQRGGIVDFLDGVRQTSREASINVKQVAPSVAAKAEETEATVGELAADNAPSPPTELQEKRSSLFQLFSRTEAVPSPLDHVAETIPQAPAVDGDAAIVDDPKPVAHRRAVTKGEAKVRRPRLVRKKSRWRWVPLVAKLAIGVVVATFLVRLQQSMPQFKYGGTGTVASSPAAVPTPTPRKDTSLRGKQTVTGSNAKTADVSPIATEGRAVKRSPVTLLLRTFDAHVGGTAAVQFADGGAKLVTVGGDGNLKVWDTKSFALLRTLELDDGPATALTVLGNQALTGHENGRIVLWDLALGMQLKSFKRNDASIASLVFAGSARFLAGAHDWSVTFWETATPSVPLHVFEGHGRDVLAIAYEPGRGLIASASADRTVKLWEIKSLSHQRTFPRAKKFITAVAFAPGGDTLLVGTLDGDLMLYSTTSRRLIKRFRGHSARITSLEFIGGGGREFVSASGDGTVRLWNRREGRARQTFGSAGAKIAGAAVSPDGRLIASAKRNGTVQIWNAVVLD